MAWPGETKTTVRNRQDSAHEKDDLFVTRVGELVMYSKIVIRGLHVNQVRILSGTSQTTNVAKKAEVILHHCDDKVSAHSKLNLWKTYKRGELTRQRPLG